MEEKRMKELRTKIFEFMKNQQTKTKLSWMKVSSLLLFIISLISMIGGVKNFSQMENSSSSKQKQLFYYGMIYTVTATFSVLVFGLLMTCISIKTYRTRDKSNDAASSEELLV